MSVLVKKMEMPEQCGLCRFCISSYRMVSCAAAQKIIRLFDNDIDGYNAREKMDWCPLVEVPTPHGRLIDAEQIKNAVFHHLSIKGEEYLLPAEKSVFGNIIKAPTVIEAEDEE